MKNTKIEWTHHTVNFWWGCTEVSEACQNCYARGIAKRFGKDCWGDDNPRWLKLDSANAEIEKLNRSAQKRGVIETVFVNSMSDFFDYRVITEIRIYCWAQMAKATNLVFLVLTKRAHVLANHLNLWADHVPPNVHFGITAENQKRLDERMKALERFDGKVFLSCEPMLGAIDITPYADRINWIICGGESGAKARFFDIEQAYALKTQCAKNGIPFFFKQFGENFSLAVANHYEDKISVREFPAWHPMGKAVNK